jgi:hypothetical protein
VGAIVMNDLNCIPQLGLCSNRATGVRIAIEARKVAAGNFDPYPMALQKDAARYARIDPVLID